MHSNHGTRNSLICLLNRSINRRNLTVAKARGVAQLAKETGLSRESLYKTFSAGTKPRFETILKITNALGVPLGVKQGGEVAHL
ncbi:MAG: putative addiction module antidote protein [Desulfobulbaceae bacterium]|jgi:probable addiction module antidote protein|nr:putative addiction module antidote protein [Desulfobulbaceae bacterium]